MASCLRLFDSQGWLNADGNLVDRPDAAWTKQSPSSILQWQCIAMKHESDIVQQHAKIRYWTRIEGNLQIPSQHLGYLDGHKLSKEIILSREQQVLLQELEVKVEHTLLMVSRHKQD